MIELYHCDGTRSFRVLWALEEMGLAYRLHRLPFPPRVRDPGYLTLNPLGTVPLMVDGDVRMTESAAILQYLASRDGASDLAVDPHEPDYGRWLDWLHRGEATLTFPLTLVLRYGRLEPTARRAPQVVEDYSRWFLSRLRSLPAALVGREWLCAGRFTVADICVGFALMAAEDLGLAGGFSGDVKDYWARLAARPAYQAARDAERAP